MGYWNHIFLKHFLNSQGCHGTDPSLRLEEVHSPGGGSPGGGSKVLLWLTQPAPGHSRGTPEVLGLVGGKNEGKMKEKWGKNEGKVREQWRTMKEKWRKNEGKWRKTRFSGKWWKTNGFSMIPSHHEILGILFLIVNQIILSAQFGWLNPQF